MKKTCISTMLILNTIFISLLLFNLSCNGTLILSEDYIQEALCNNNACPNTNNLNTSKTTCVDVICNTNEVCLNGQCQPNENSDLCSQTFPNGACPDSTDICINGICYPDGDNPLPCGEDPNGWCPENKACIDNICVPIDPEQNCSPDTINGLCPGGQICIMGWCYNDDVLCSAENTFGYCSKDFICQNGICQESQTTCSLENTNGTCPDWQKCIEGECIGQISQDACSPNVPTGNCPIDFICVSGTCVPLNDDNQCSVSKPQGLCPTGASCDNGVCIHIDEQNGCSTLNPQGLCSGGATCFNGSCVHTQCKDGGWFCKPDTWCQKGECVPLNCSLVHPQGHCEDPTDICTFGICEEGPCSLLNLDGTCISSDYTYHPELVRIEVNEVCCDEYLNAAYGCDLGACTLPLCSIEEPHGVCITNENTLSDDSYCEQGICQPASCSPAFQTGFCGNVDEICYFGFCVKGGCSIVPDPDSFCSPNICNYEENICIRPPCSNKHPAGFCLEAGYTCIDGICAVPDCSLAYPGGKCANEKLCAGGECITPPCSFTYPEGVCGPNFECQNGECKRSACSIDAPAGQCNSGSLCIDNSCEEFMCSSTFPEGPCEPGKVCEQEMCLVPNCSSDYPGGQCNNAEEICSGGMCVKQPCSPLYPTGECAVGFSCENGACLPAECSTLVTNGVCTDENKDKVCLNGECVLYVCSEYFPMGPCPLGEICDVSLQHPTCHIPDCAEQYPGGNCPSPDICVNGSCVRPACSEYVPNGTCPANQICCNADMEVTDGCIFGRCVLAACGSENPQGQCSTGKVCCDQTLLDDGFCQVSQYGECVTIACSLQFPFGECLGADSDKICVNGSCQDPCKPSAPSGWCPTGFACVESACAYECPNDADCDGISNTDENLSSLVDTDSDGSPDGRDRDADGDLIPDSVEASDLDILTAPVDTDSDGDSDFCDLDSDNDHISDTFEAGSAPAVPRDTDGDGQADYQDFDSDNDGILDACEVGDGPGGICSISGIIDSSLILDSDQDGRYDFIDTDSDGDGIEDTIESRLKPADGTTWQTTGVDSDQDGLPDYRDFDSDDDGVADIDEDTNGDGVVNCQMDGEGNIVFDNRGNLACNDSINCPNGAASAYCPFYTYDYNPGCETWGIKCVLAESSRVHPDSDGDTIADNEDGIFYVCSTDNLKPINLFYSQDVDYAFALEPVFDQVSTLYRNNLSAGMTFDDPDSSHGSYAVSGFILQRTPDNTALSTTTTADPERELIEKALAQEVVDRNLIKNSSQIDSIVSVIGRNFTSFDGYGSVISHYRIKTASGLNNGALRNEIVQRLAPGITSNGLNHGPSTTDFTLLTQTLYRWDNGLNLGSVIVVAALVPTGANANDDASYNYRTHCFKQPNQSLCEGRTGCFWNGICQEQSNYQIPLFYADNISNGSALTQYGDDVAALCQSLIQQYGLLDFLWVIDDSGSMTQEIRQVQMSAQLFFGILNNTEADYRIAQSTTFEEVSDWEPTAVFDDYAIDEFRRRNGALKGGFTGAIAGQVDPTRTDRKVSYNCSDGCDNGQTDCCHLCGSGTIEDPACYFAAKLPTAESRGSEFGLLMGMWALYRAGADSQCTLFNDNEQCDDTRGCMWFDGMCMANYCTLPKCNASQPEDCESIAGCAWINNTCQIGIDDNDPMDECNGHDTSQIPAGLDELEDELELAGCEWNPNADNGQGACWPSIGESCSSKNTLGDCNNLGLRCHWQNGQCIPNLNFNTVLCSAHQNATSCQNQGNGWCKWDNDGFCRPPELYAFRNQANRVVVFLSDEEECYLKDKNFNASCDYDVSNFLSYDHPIRLAREQAYLKYYQSRDILSFAIVGDKPDRALSPSGTNGGCSNAQAGDAYIKVAEGTGGGWGSIGAADLYPTIEAIVINSIARASPYRLEAQIDGKPVQPIASTIKVTSEVCTLSNEYPNCSSGTHMQVVSRSRDNGFDYDAMNNVLILYGNARPVKNGDIVVSYRYWVDNIQNPQNNSNCPCPETTSPACSCPPGLACGSDTQCVNKQTQSECEFSAGCVWNTVLGCVVSGLCEADPSCGGICAEGSICDPNLGLCVCDVSCGAGCSAGMLCDNNSECAPYHEDQSACEAKGNCQFDVVRQSCYSNTCGQCACDTTCAGGCPAGQICIDNLSSPQCGQCACDTTCAGDCPTGQSCNNDVNSPTCGFCQPPQCGDCPPGTRCDPNTGLCICDTNCGGSCPLGTNCDDNAFCDGLDKVLCEQRITHCYFDQLQNNCISYNCGQCGCDVTCNGGCPEGQQCDHDLQSPSCGLCIVDPTCGVNNECNPNCNMVQEAFICQSRNDCRWASWLNKGQGGCSPLACEICDPHTGFCIPDPTCCNACAPTEICNPFTGSCECDTTCGHACAPGLTCDTFIGSQTCGLCLCDTTCGGDCPAGQVCDNNSACTFYTDEASCYSASSGQCAWDLVAQTCLSVFCGSCVVACTECPPNHECDPTTGLCVPFCPECPLYTVCDPLTGTCVCDQSCGNACPLGQFCDNRIDSPTCGQCYCDTTCGGACPSCQECDRDPLSPTCGMCMTDYDCSESGGCDDLQICDILSGCCMQDPECGGWCPSGYKCDPYSGNCVYTGGEG